MYSENLNENGMVADFGEVKALVQQYDHKMLNEIPPFDKLQPTSERLAREIADQCLAKWPHIMEISVLISETEGSDIEYTISYDEEEDGEEAEIDVSCTSVSIPAATDGI